MPKTQILDPVVALKLDRVRHFCIDFNALALMEERTGRNILDPRSFEDVNMRTMRTIIHCALRHEDDTLTEHDVGALISPTNLPYVMTRLSEAWRATNGEASEDPFARGMMADLMQIQHPS